MRNLIAIVIINLIISVSDVLSKNTNTNTNTNIIFIMIDDLGWNDISFHGGCDYETANIDALASEGLLLDNYYVQHSCSPTRSALLTGQYPIHNDMWDVLSYGSTFGMPLTSRTLANELQDAGYATYLVGKWHLGHCAWEFTPTRRGFDTFFGFYGSQEDYYSHDTEWSCDNKYDFTGYDLRLQDNPVTRDDYSTWMYANATIDILAGQDQLQLNVDAKPFFIYLSFQAAHDVLSAPDDVVAAMKEKKLQNRATYAAVVTVLDESIGQIVDYLKHSESKLWDNTMIIFSSDNGGNHYASGNNFPLRGQKSTVWEGGVRAAAFIAGGWLAENRRGGTMNALMHVTDWYPTLCSVAGITSTFPALDGFDQSGNIQNGVTDIYDPREEVVHTILTVDSEPSYSSSDGVDGITSAGFRWRNYKLVIGDEVNDWSRAGWYKLTTKAALKAALTASHQHTVECSNGFDYQNYDYTVYNQDSVICTDEACLFDVSNDPCELTDLRLQLPHIYSQMWKRVLEVSGTVVDRISAPELDVDALNPDNHAGFWSPWMDVDGNSLVDAAIATARYLPNSCLARPDGPAWLKLTPDSSAIRTTCSNGYLIIAPRSTSSDSELNEWAPFFSSFREYHYAVAGPVRDDHSNWQQWFIPIMKEFIVSPDCQTCDPTHELNTNYPLRSAYYSTAGVNGCTQTLLARAACDMDIHTYACRACDPTGSTGYLVSRNVYNGLNDPDTTLHFNEIEDAEDYRHGLCHLTIKDAKAEHPSDTFKHCKTITLEDASSEDIILPRRKPSIGTDGRFCVCAKNSLFDYKEYEFDGQDYNDAEIRNAELEEDTAENAELEDADAITYLYQSNFESGTYRITASGTYVLMEDIVFDFNAPDGYKTREVDSYQSGWWPTADQADSYPGAGDLRGEYSFGFYAGISIECSHVILDLNSHSIGMSRAFYYQQTFFANIALTSQTFLPSQGPAFFGSDPQSATDVVIKNGKLGLSSHHGIQGYFNRRVLIEGLHISQFKTHGIQLNGFEDVTIRDVDIGNNVREELLSPYYAQVRHMLPTFEKVAAMDAMAKHCLTFARDNPAESCITIGELVQQVRALLDMAFEYVMFGIDPEEEALAGDQLAMWRDNKGALLSATGNPQTATLYGIFLNYGGSNVIMWYAGTEELKSNKYTLEDVHIHDLYHNTFENLAVYRTAVDNSAQNRHRFFNCINAPFNAYHIFGDEQVNAVSGCFTGATSCYDSSGRLLDFSYVGNKLIDIQLFVMKLLYDHGLSWDYCSAGAQDTSSLIEFAFDNTQFKNQPGVTSDMLSFSGERTEISFGLAGTHDPMIHPGKGVLGLRLNGVNQGQIRGVTIENIHSATALGTMLGGPYRDIPTQHAPYLSGFSMNMANGFSVTFCKDLVIDGAVTVRNVQSNTGLAYGMAIWYETTITATKQASLAITSVHAGTEVEISRYRVSEHGDTDWEILNNLPNKIPEACAIARLDDEVYVSQVDLPDDRIQIRDIAGLRGCFGKQELTLVGQVGVQKGSTGQSRVGFGWIISASLALLVIAIVMIMIGIAFRRQLGKSKTVESVGPQQYGDVDDNESTALLQGATEFAYNDL